MGWNIPVHWFNPTEMVFKTSGVCGMGLQFALRKITTGGKQSIEKMVMAKQRLI